MKRWISILMVGLLFAGTSVNLHAETSTDEDDPFAGIDIVTEENAVPVDKNTIEGMKDAEMGDGVPNSDRNKGRSAYGTSWDMTPGAKKFYDGTGKQMYGVGAKMVIDVSKFQGVIDWDAVKNSGVDGAILRITFGWDNGFDPQFLRNVSECNRLGIPYGVYIYSYANNANIAYLEAASLVKLLSSANVNLSYPIYYDIENFDPYLENGVTITHPTSPAQYEPIIATFIDYMNKHGYEGKTHVYSFRSYLQNELNSSAILKNVSWIAAYTTALNYTNQFYNGTQGWQYSSKERIPGIAGDVDVSAFSDVMFNASVSATVPESVTSKLTEKNIKFNKGYLNGFTLGADIASIKDTLSSIGEVILYDKNGSVISGGKLATGQIIEVKITTRSSDYSYKMAVVIRGDVNGDGDIRSNDYALIKNDILNVKKLNGAAYKAADVSGDDLVRSNDYAVIKNYILGRTNINQ